jgi:hypothetical protein
MMSGHGQALCRPLSEGVRLIFSRGDQLAQIAVDEQTPCVRAASVALDFGHEACVGKTDFDLAGLFGDFEYNIGAIP